MTLVVDPYRFAAADTFIMPYRQDVLTWSSIDGSGGLTFNRAQSSNYLSGGATSQASLADADDGDYMEWFFNLAAGTYTLTFIYYKDQVRGIYTISIDGVDVATVDGYNSGGASYNNVSTTTGIIVAADGNYTVRVRINGKHASSTDYLLGNQTITLHRTGA